MAEPDYQLLTRTGHGARKQHAGDTEAKKTLSEAVYRQLTELHRYLLAIQGTRWCRENQR